MTIRVGGEEYDNMAEYAASESLEFMRDVVASLDLLNEIHERLATIAAVSYGRMVMLPTGVYVNPAHVEQVWIVENKRIQIEMASGNNIEISANYVKSNFEALRAEIVELLFPAAPCV